MFCLEDAKKLQVLFLFMCSLSLENVKKMFVLSVFSSCVFRLEDAKKMQELVSSLRASSARKPFRVVAVEG